ncbi:MAG: hypothetical protein LJE64_08540 [Desulfofustis sp.]|nr:hypothetical protein [Desulfofustis sp.]
MKPRFPSLVFPDTDIFNEHQFPLLIFGRPLYYLQPVEPDPDRDRESDHDCFIKRGLCQALTPVPLGEHRERFVRLIHDIENRRDDYAAQLTALTIAEMGSNKQQAGNEQRHRIVSSLIGRDAAGSPDKDIRVAEYWQARLVLAIAEMLKREQFDLQQELQMLDAQELEMLRSLQGDQDTDEPDPFKSLEAASGDLSGARSRDHQLRFRSWRTLMSAAPLPPVSFWLASSVDAADEIFIAYERLSDLPVRPILKVPLPDHIGASPIYAAEQIANFQEDAEETLQELFEELGQTLTRDDPSGDAVNNLLPGSSNLLVTWEELLDGHFPAGSHGRASLVFYLLRRCRLADLLNLEASGSDHHQHALLGVFKRG